MASEANWIFSPLTITEKLNALIDSTDNSEIQIPENGFYKRWKVFIVDSIGIDQKGNKNVEEIKNVT